MTFCTAINCMDGRVQMPVIEYLQERFDAEYVDTITEPGPIRILSEQENRSLIRSILERVKISVEEHGSVGIAVVSHHDCAGNPSEKAEKLGQIQEAIEFLKDQYGAITIIGLWVDEAWTVHEVTTGEHGQSTS